MRTVSVVCPIDHNETDAAVNGNSIEKLVFVQMDKNELKQFEKKGLVIFIAFVCGF